MALPPLSYLYLDDSGTRNPTGNRRTSQRNAIVFALAESLFGRKIRKPFVPPTLSSVQVGKSPTLFIQLKFATKQQYFSWLWDFSRPN